MNIYYTIYKTTNLVNGMIYIGKHKTTNPNDSYLGSGAQFKEALAEFGRKNFKKEVLFIFDNKEEMNSKEAELVDIKFVLREDTYNMVLGGGSFGRSGIRCSSEHRRKMSEAKIGKTRKPFSEDHKKKIGESRIGFTHSNEARMKISKARKTQSGPNKGRKFSDEHRRKLSEASKKAWASKFSSKN